MTMGIDGIAHEVWHGIAIGLDVVLALLATGHVVLHKRDPRSAIAWVGFVWLVPVAGALLYLLFGVNRIRHKAAYLRRSLERYDAHTARSGYRPEAALELLEQRGEHLQMLARVVGRVVERPLLPGNRVEPLVNGEQAYPAMLEAIRNARHSVSLQTYIFDLDEVGSEFARTLGEAARRGVEVRVLIDATGTRYSWPPILKTLKQEGVRYALFLPSFALRHLMSVNMRTHRKIAVVDGRIGFTGGMNIRAAHCVEGNTRRPVQDIHFRLEGPVVTRMQEVFADDWLFTSGEALRGDDWFPRLDEVGPTLARGVIDGPDENFEKLLWTLLGALSVARRSVRIVTPYFLPDPAVMSALVVAAMRGVQIDIILPERSNLPFVTWASRAIWPELLQHGCRIWLTPPPFDHSKLLLVDGGWMLLGSANWDARSLRLNFEFNVECYDSELAARMERWFEEKLAAAHRVTREEIAARSLPARLRDDVARLLTPYL